MYDPIKKLGQNFLTETEIVIPMVHALDLRNDDTVVEIGPGLGIITKVLADRLTLETSEIHAVEIDERFAEKLKAMFIENMNVDVVEADFLKWYPTFAPKRNFKVVGSLPYYITSPIIHSILEKAEKPEVCVFLIQKEVAQKIAAKVPDASYMSTIVQTFYNVESLDLIHRSRFTPEPEVDGQIIKLTLRRAIKVSPQDIQKYESFLHRAFSNPRKMLNKIFSKEEAEKTGMDLTMRAQNLDADSWAEIFRTIVQ